MAKGRNDCCTPSEWCNNCCPNFQRIFVFILAVGVFGVALWQAAQVGKWRQEMFDDFGGRNDETRTNDVSADLLNISEFSGVFTMGAGLAFIWHILKWNVATRQVAVRKRAQVLAISLACARSFCKPWMSTRGLARGPVVLRPSCVFC